MAEPERRSSSGERWYRQPLGIIFLTVLAGVVVWLLTTVLPRYFGVLDPKPTATAPAETQPAQQPTTPIEGTPQRPRDSDGKKSEPKPNRATGEEPQPQPVERPEPR